MTPTLHTRINRCLRHIRDHPDSDLSLDGLADVAALSRFHFHRTFTAITGETVAEAVRRIRMNRAAVLLATTDRPLAEIARSVGYPNPQSMARAFRAVHGLTPAAVRRSGRPCPEVPAPPKGVPPMFPIEIRQMPAARVAAMAHSGSYQTIGASFGRLWQRLNETGLVAQIAGPGIGIYHDAPGSVAETDQRAHAGVVIAADAILPADLESLSLPAGRAAVLTFRGPYDCLHEAWSYIYGTWLPANGEEAADAPPYERNLNSPMDTAPADLITEIVLPLAAISPAGR